MPRSLEENPKELFGTLLRLEENASAFELKCTCVFGNALLGVLRGESK
jgi:hypothetical protein